MKYNREQAIKETLKWEGGYTNDTNDSGGPTNYGITIHDVRAYVNPNATAADVKKLTLDQAVNIYTSKYWKTPSYDCDTLASGVDFSVFDFGVNSGPTRAKTYLNKAIGGTDEQTIVKLNDARLAFVNGIVSRNPSQSKFLKGWTTRINGVKAKALQMNKAKAPATPVNPGHASAFTAIMAGIGAFITGHKALIIVAGALFLVAGISYYLQNRKQPNV